MRELKFRAWDKITKQIFEVKQINFNAIERNVYGWITYKELLGKVEESLSFRSFDDVELMQYTGLKDKNGKEIYEGDILKSESGTWLCEVRDSPSFAGFDFKIIKAPAGCEWQIGDNFILSELRINEAGYEVIGNIHENSELLK